MATSTASGDLQNSTTRGVDDSFAIRVFQLASSLGILVFLGLLAISERADLEGELPEIALWAAVALAADLMLVRVGKGVTLTMSLPVSLAAALLFHPAFAALVAFAGCLDPMEVRGESSLSRAIFNRSQVALATAAAALVFYFGDVNAAAWPTVALWSLVALAADFAVNAAFVVPTIVLRDRTSPLTAIRLLFGSAPADSTVLYVSMGLVAPLIAAIYLTAGAWGLLFCLVPLALARGGLVRAERLHEARERVATKDEALRRTTESVGEERRDERVALAGELHDEVLPPLFKVHLMGQVLKEDLDAGRLLDLDSDLPELLAATAASQAAVRHVVDQLRRSSLGPDGLVGTVRLLAEHLQSSGAPPVDLFLEDLDGSDEALLVLYQVAKEALTNAAKYSKARRITVRMWEEDHNGRLIVSDAGVGFETSNVDLRNHFGLQLMKERVESRGGKLVVESRLGDGTTVAAKVPLRAEPIE
jgi:signal transduction histidine kinase